MRCTVLPCARGDFNSESMSTINFEPSIVVRTVVMPGTFRCDIHPHREQKWVLPFERGWPLVSCRTNPELSSRPALRVCRLEPPLWALVERLPFVVLFARLLRTVWGATSYADNTAMASKVALKVGLR